MNNMKIHYLQGQKSELYFLQHFSRVRIFHFNADIIKTCFEVLRVIFSQLIKHQKLHLQLIVFYGSHLLQRAGWEAGGKMKKQVREWQQENAIQHLVWTVERKFLLHINVCQQTGASTTKETWKPSLQMCYWKIKESVFCTLSSSLSPTLSSSERIWILKSNSSPRLIKALISCMQPPCQKHIIMYVWQFILTGGMTAAKQNNICHLIKYRTFL